jgi:hypothetical protein
MRTGTLLCWLFGHKFIFTETEYSRNITTGQRSSRTVVKQIPYCVRCGIDKEPT